MPFASVNEVRNFFSRFGIDDPAKFWRAAGGIAKHAAVVGDQTHLNPANARVTGDDLLRIVRLELIEMSFVKHTIQQGTHAVRLAMTFRNEAIDLFQRSFRSSAFGNRDCAWRL